MPRETRVIIYTDGGCIQERGAGGWGARLIYLDNKKDIFGSAQNTTTNRMELTAAIEALKALKKPCKVKLFTDSMYVKDGITNRTPAKNKDLWVQLLEQNAIHDVEWKWVKSHSGNEGNDAADRLACKGRDEAILADSAARNKKILMQLREHF